jgi:O-antigen/teichoic acid export membrane protein
VPFYVLIVGLAFNVIAYVPYSLLTAIGKTGWTARCHLVELVPYVILAALLTARLGAVGAALASSLRLISTLPLFAFLAGRAAGLSFTLFGAGHKSFLIALLVLTLPALLLSGWLTSVAALVAVGMLSLAGYGFLVWRNVLICKEREWLGQQMQFISARFARSAV